MNFKKMLALLCALMLCIPAAFAQTVQVEGEIAVTGYDTLTGEITALYDENGLFAELSTGGSVMGQKLADGSMLLTDNDMSTAGMGFVMPAFDLSGSLQAVNAFLDGAGEEITYENAVYSSLFTRALSVDLSSDIVAPVLTALLKQYPILGKYVGADADAVAALAATSAQWGNITRYKGDAMQYPDLSLIILSLNIPSLPNLYLWLRVDEFGTTFKIAREEGTVTDWEETVLALTDAQSETGFIVNGFTLNFEDDEELNIYIEATLITTELEMTLECDYYVDYTGEYLWAVEAILYEATEGDLLELTIEAVETEEEFTAPDLSALNAVGIEMLLP
ncbi:MAG: hypothetical protein IKW00_09290 [Clostridia bacterium]|nr:hypothetical protein [Clostridia bacterium]